jgi:putative ABC transport system ATP-binding protein
MPQAAIKAEGVVKWFGEGEARTNALKNVELEASFGEMVYIVGPSGSGKTTLLSVLSGILRPDAGTVRSEGVSIWELSKDELADFRLNKIGFVFQDYHLFPRLTTAENVAIPLILKRRKWEDALSEAHKYLEIVGLKNRAELPPVKLSGGEQQRVAIARAIASQPDILIMDEPTASLDGDTGRAIVGFVKSTFLNTKRCILVVTHDSRISEFATRILHMEDGRLAGQEKGNENAMDLHAVGARVGGSLHRRLRGQPYHGGAVANVQSGVESVRGRDLCGGDRRKRASEWRKHQHVSRGFGNSKADLCERRSDREAGYAAAAGG